MQEIKWYRCIYLNSAKDKLLSGFWYGISPECSAEIHITSMILAFPEEPLWDIETSTAEQRPSDSQPYVNPFN